MSGWNFTEDEGKEYIDVTEGEHKFVISEVNPPKESERTPGVWTCSLVCQVASGASKGGRVYHNLILSHPDAEKNKICRGITKSFVIAATGREELRNENDLVGKTFVGKVKLDEYQGKTRPKISYAKTAVALNNSSKGNSPSMDEIPF